MTTPTPDALCERLRDHAGDLTVGYCHAVPKDLVRQAAALIQQQQATIERLSAEKAELERALVKAYGRWTLSCDPNGDFPDWPDDPAGVVNDLWKDGWPAMAGAALGKDASDVRSPGSSEGE